MSELRFLGDPKTLRKMRSNAGVPLEDMAKALGIPLRQASDGEWFSGVLTHRQAKCWAELCCYSEAMAMLPAHERLPKRHDCPHTMRVWTREGHCECGDCGALVALVKT